MAEGGRLELVTAERDGHYGTGRPDLAGYTPRRVYISACCGAKGTEPSHAPYCDRRHALRIRNGTAAETARQMLADYDQRKNAGTLSDHGDEKDHPFFQLGALSTALRMVLDDLDREAGASDA